VVLGSNPSGPIFYIFGFNTILMQKKLLLTSEGIQPEIRDVFLDCLNKTPNKNKVSFITTAAYGENVNPAWLDIDRKLLEDCGIEDIEEFDLKNKTQKEIGSKLSDKDIIFVNGGNTFYLLYWVKKSGFNQLLPKLLDEGKLYVGVSAGSYIACPTIEAATWKHGDKNKIGLEDLTGLNLVPFLITPHFEEKYRTIIETSAKTTKYPIVALYNTQAVLVEDSLYRVVGKGRREFFNGFKDNK
jgi:dipeptidase E